MADQKPAQPDKYCSHCAEMIPADDFDRHVRSYKAARKRLAPKKKGGLLRRFFRGGRQEEKNEEPALDDAQEKESGQDQGQGQGQDGDQVTDKSVKDETLEEKEKRTQEKLQKSKEVGKEKTAQKTGAQVEKGGQQLSQKLLKQAGKKILTSPYFWVAVLVILGILLIIMLISFIAGYDKKFSTGSGAGGTTTCVGNVELSASELKAIEENTPVYKEAAAQLTPPISWEILVGLHYREHSFSRITPKHNIKKNVKGKIVWDRDNGVFQIVSKDYGHAKGYKLTDAEFLVQVIDAANFINNKVSGNLTENPEDELVKKAFWYYNGTGGQAYKDQAAKFGFDPETQAYEGSPYVMSRFDAARDRTMGIITKDGGSVDGIDTKYGAFVIYTMLRSSGESCIEETGGGGGEIVAGEVPRYNQCDPEWGQKIWVSSTICSSGCGPSSLASIISFFTGSRVTPYDIAQQIKKYYVAGAGIAYAAFTQLGISWGQQYGLKGGGPISFSKVKSTLESGGLIIASMGNKGTNGTCPSDIFTTGGHIVAVVGIDEQSGKIFLVDSSSRNHKKVDIGLFKSCNKNLFTVKKK